MQRIAVGAVGRRDLFMGRSLAVNLHSACQPNSNRLGAATAFDTTGVCEFDTS
jgi:hypothetical protein